MIPSEMYTLIDHLLDGSKTAVFATVDEDGKPSLRWMTPRFLRDRPGCLHALCMTDSRKVAHVRTRPHGVWLIQTPSLSDIVSVAGRTSVVESPTLLKEFLDQWGRDVFTFWQLNPPPAIHKLALLETVIEEVTRFRPGTNELHTVRLAT